ncbi:MAG TPA: TIR domain-containing protein [Candidatus Binatia bacterium]|jgi:hypothetical protein|nr:TIR domain-containing protein [Candidatus Binatia bacterium]
MRNAAVWGAANTETSMAIRDPFDLFIIHVADDAKVALELAIEFERVGYRAWCYELDSLPLGNYIENIRRGIETASVLLVLVSRSSLDKDEEVTREIHFGQAGDKAFIPLVLDLSDAEFDREVPLTWRQAFGEAVRVRLDPARLAVATGRIAEGLKARGLTPREAPIADARLPTLQQLIDGLPHGGPTHDARQTGHRLAGGIKRFVRLHRSTLIASIVTMLVALALMRLAGIMSIPSPAPEPSAGTITVWIVDPTLEGFGVQMAGAGDAALGEYRLLRRSMEADLLRIASASNVALQIVNDDEIEMALVNAGCPDVKKKFQIPECAEKRAFDHLQIRVKVDPTFHGSEDGKRDLTLRIGRGTGVLMLPHSESLKDANLTTLADWSAEQIALFLRLPQDRIAEALGRQRENNRLLEDSLGVGSAAPPGGRNSFLPSLIGEAFADAITTNSASATADADVRRAVEQLRETLETQDASRVAACFVSMSPDQRDALQRYFDNVDDLKVSFASPEITVDGETARVAFLREDRFRDKMTGERTSLAIRLVAVLVRANGAWRVESLQKPS